MGHNIVTQRMKSDNILYNTKSYVLVDVREIFLQFEDL